MWKNLSIFSVISWPLFIQISSKIVNFVFSNDTCGHYEAKNLYIFVTWAAGRVPAINRVLSLSSQTKLNIAVTVVSSVRNGMLLLVAVEEQVDDGRSVVSADTQLPSGL